MVQAIAMENDPQLKEKESENKGRKLEDYSIEVLEAALAILRAQQGAPGD
jgi:hypothetical protein